MLGTNLPVSAELIPLYVGNSWKYKMLGQRGEPVSNRVIKSARIDGTYWYGMEEWGDLYWVRSTDQGQEEAMNLFDIIDLPDDTKIEKRDVFYRIPKSLDETLEYKASAGEMKARRLTEKVKVPAGEFDVIEYLYKESGDPGDLVMRTLISPGVGIIRFETQDTSAESNTKAVYVLESYELNRPVARTGG
ncbi:MAG: hypothetical protein AAGH89_16940 [Verrucomicrobiota bacterium]